MNSNDFKGLRYNAPDELRSNLKALVNGSPKKQVVLNIRFGNWLGAAMGAVAMAGFVIFSQFSGHLSSAEQVTLEIANSHIRSLLVDHVFDVESTDRHTVKPWFNGKLDFSPRIIDTAAEGFPMVGGRLDYVGARPVAAVVYRRDKHIINLFTWPTSGSASVKAAFSTIQGFNIWHWSEKGMSYYAISDLNANLLHDFVEELRNHD